MTHEKFSSFVREPGERPKASQDVDVMSLPLNRLTGGQKKVARDLLKAGWTLKEVAPMFNITVRELKF